MVFCKLVSNQPLKGRLSRPGKITLGMAPWTLEFESHRFCDQIYSSNISLSLVLNNFFFETSSDVFFDLVLGLYRNLPSRIPIPAILQIRPFLQIWLLIDLSLI